MQTVDIKIHLDTRTSLLHLEQRLAWAYEGSRALNGRIDWDAVNVLRCAITQLENRLLDETAQ